MTEPPTRRPIRSVDDLPGPDEWPELAEFLRRSVAAAHTHTYAEPDDIERLRARIIPPVTSPGDDNGEGH
ncbi:hypothetical protein [Micromonospora sp. NBC_00421]|uniref:hypothetical protein n=1 Tax=Micromonospora sp. NBC_00421 TaxID=2975976 RepID=UPI002E1D5479